MEFAKAAVTVKHGLQWGSTRGHVSVRADSGQHHKVMGFLTCNSILCTHWLLA